MINLKKFIKASLFGGIVVILPILILIFFFRWLFRLVTDMIQPLTNIMLKQYGMAEIFADAMILTIIILICFSVGFMVQTRLGKLLHQIFDRYLLRMAPGYRMVKEVVVQIFGDNKNSPFSNAIVARVKLFGSNCPTEVTALVTDTHEDGSYTIFMPTGPNPTSGNIYHVNAEQVTICPDIRIDSAMRTIIACGAGSATIFKPSHNKDKPEL